MEQQDLSLAQLRRLTGASRKALLLYESRGLLSPPGRTYTGWRRYSPKTVEEVQFIRSALKVGLRLRDLRPALDAWRKGQSACPSLTHVLKQRASELDAQLQKLAHQQERLTALVRQWDPCCPPTDGVCPQVSQETRPGD